MHLPGPASRRQENLVKRARHASDRTATSHASGSAHSSASLPCTAAGSCSESRHLLHRRESRRSRGSRPPARSPNGRNNHNERVQSQSVSDPQLSISAEDGDVLRSLLDWLRHEDTLRGRVRTAPTPVRPGEMGGVLDVLMVALGSGGAGVALATSVSTWLSQPRRTDVKLTVTAESGRQIKLDARRVQDPAVLLREIERLLRPDASEQ